MFYIKATSAAHILSNAYKNKISPPVQIRFHDFDSIFSTTILWTTEYNYPNVFIGLLIKKSCIYKHARNINKDKYRDSLFFLSSRTIFIYLILDLRNLSIWRIFDFMLKNSEYYSLNITYYVIIFVFNDIMQQIYISLEYLYFVISRYLFFV